MKTLVKLFSGTSIVTLLSLVAVGPVFAGDWSWAPSVSSSSSSSASVSQHQSIDSYWTIDPWMKQSASINLYNEAADGTVSEANVSGTQELLSWGANLEQTQVLKAESKASSTGSHDWWDSGSTPWWVSPPVWWSTGPTINNEVQVDVNNVNENIITWPSNSGSSCWHNMCW